MSKHVVRIVDPYFGQYWNLTVPFGGNWPTTRIGPLTERLLYDEVMDWKGQKATTGSFKERTVKHDYVDGMFMKATPQRFRQPDLTLWVPFAPGYHLCFYPTDATLWKCTVNVTFEHEEETWVQARFDLWRQWGTMPGFPPIFTFTGGVVVRASKTWLPESSRASYSDPKVIVRTGACSPNAQVQSGAGPFVPGIDSTIEAYPSVWSYLQQAKKETAKKYYRIDHSLRDIAIYEALENITVANINAIETVGDLRDLGALLEPLRMLPHIEPSPRSILKAISHLHLWWKYVIKTSILDIHEFHKLIRWLRKNLGNLRQIIGSMYLIGRGNKSITKTAHNGQVAIRYGYKACYKACVDQFTSWMDTLAMLKFVPRLTDIWDIVPYSFVVDWVVPVGDAIDHTELNSIQQRMPFKYGVFSHKVTRTIQHDAKVGVHPYTVDIDIVHYNREVQLQFPPDVWLGLDFRDPRKQGLTAMALIVGRLTNNP